MSPSLANAAPSLTNRTLRAFGWRFCGKVFGLAIKLAVMILLARLLSVEAFGVISQVMTIALIARILSEAGMAPAIIQRPDLSDTHIRVAFTISVAIGGVLSLALCFGAPFAGAAFHSAILVPVLRLVSLTFLFESFGVVSQALLHRFLRFRTLAFIELAAYTTGFGVVGSALAFAGAGVWALAWATVAEGFLRSVLLLIVSRHALSPCLARSEANQLLRFGIPVTLSRLADHVAAYGDYFVVGRYLGAASLGLYSRAYQVMTLPTSEFSAAVNAVLLPSYASVQDDPARLRRGYLTAVAVSALVTVPIVALVAVAAPELVVGVLGSKWGGAIVPLQLLCIGGALRPLLGLGDALARAKGAVVVCALYKSAHAAAVVIAAIACLPWGIVGVAAGVSAALAGASLLIAGLSIRLVGASPTGVLRALCPGITVAAAGSAGALLFRHLLCSDTTGLLYSLLGMATFCAAASLTTLWVLPTKKLDQGLGSLLEQAANTAREFASRLLARSQRRGPLTVGRAGKEA